MQQADHISNNDSIWVSIIYIHFTSFPHAGHLPTLHPLQKVLDPLPIIIKVPIRFIHHRQLSEPALLILVLLPHLHLRLNTPLYNLADSPILQKVVCDGLLRRHAPRILRRRFKHSVATTRPIEIPQRIIAEHRTEPLFAIRSSRAQHPASSAAAAVAVSAALEAGVGAVFADFENGCD